MNMAEMWRAEEKTRLAFGLRLACSQLLAINCKSVGKGIPYTVYDIRHTEYPLALLIRRPTWAHAQSGPKTLENRSSHINSFRGHSLAPLFLSLSPSALFIAAYFSFPLRFVFCIFLFLFRFRFRVICYLLNTSTRNFVSQDL